MDQMKTPKKETSRQRWEDLCDDEDISPQKSASSKKEEFKEIKSNGRRKQIEKPIQKISSQSSIKFVIDQAEEIIQNLKMVNQKVYINLYEIDQDCNEKYIQSLYRDCNLETIICNQAYPNICDLQFCSIEDAQKAVKKTAGIVKSQFFKMRNSNRGIDSKIDYKNDKYNEKSAVNPNFQKNNIKKQQFPVKNYHIVSRKDSDTQQNEQKNQEPIQRNFENQEKIYKSKQHQKDLQKQITYEDAQIIQRNDPNKSVTVEQEKKLQEKKSPFGNANFRDENQFIDTKGRLKSGDNINVDVSKESNEQNQKLQQANKQQEKQLSNNQTPEPSIDNILNPPQYQLQTQKQYIDYSSEYHYNYPRKNQNFHQNQVQKHQDYNEPIRPQQNLQIINNYALPKNDNVQNLTHQNYQFSNFGPKNTIQYENLAEGYNQKFRTKQNFNNLQQKDKQLYQANNLNQNKISPPNMIKLINSVPIINNQGLNLSIQNPIIPVPHQIQNNYYSPNNMYQQNTQQSLNHHYPIAKPLQNINQKVNKIEDYAAGYQLKPRIYPVNIQKKNQEKQYTNNEQQQIENSPLQKQSDENISQDTHNQTNKYLENKTQSSSKKQFVQKQSIKTIYVKKEIQEDQKVSDDTNKNTNIEQYNKNTMNSFQILQCESP